MRILQIILIIPLISQNDQNVFRQDFCDLHEAFQFFRKRFLSDNFIPATYSAPRFFSINKRLGKCSLQLEDIEHERVNQQRSSNTTNIFVPRTNCPNGVFRETNCPIRQNVPLSPQRQIVPSDKLSQFLPGDKMSQLMH